MSDKYVGYEDAIKSSHAYKAAIESEANWATPKTNSSKMTTNEYMQSLQKKIDDTEIEFKFKENKILTDIFDYITNTYGSHYAQSKKQATEIIIDQGHGTGFCMGNILKYAQRYGKKDGHNKNDLMKVIHYAIIQLSQDHYK